MCYSYKNRFKIKLDLKNWFCLKQTQYLIIKLYIYKKTIAECMQMYTYTYI